MKEESRVFARAIDKKHDVSQTFFADFGFNVANSTKTLESEQALHARLRKLMRRGCGGGRLFDFAAEAEPHRAKAEALLGDGRVGAVDGTTALGKIDFMNTTQYACAVGWITSRARGEPRISITETSSAYLDPGRIEAADDSEIGG
jgi:hypothetical protein